MWIYFRGRTKRISLCGCMNERRIEDEAQDLELSATKSRVRVSVVGDGRDVQSEQGILRAPRGMGVPSVRDGLASWLDLCVPDASRHGGHDFQSWVCVCWHGLPWSAVIFDSSLTLFILLPLSYLPALS